jgi:hypothetical protein
MVRLPDGRIYPAGLALPYVVAKLAFGSDALPVDQSCGKTVNKRTRMYTRTHTRVSVRTQSALFAFVLAMLAMLTNNDTLLPCLRSSTPEGAPRARRTSYPAGTPPQKAPMSCLPLAAAAAGSAGGGARTAPRRRRRQRQLRVASRRRRRKLALPLLPLLLLLLARRMRTRLVVLALAVVMRVGEVLGRTRRSSCSHQGRCRKHPG